MQTKRRVLMAPDDRRRQLLSAATTVFAQKGYRHASVSDIIEAAGVARGTFYLYFDSKQEVFLAIVESFHSLITDALKRLGSAPVPQGDPRAIIEANLRQWLGLFAANRDTAIVLLREATSIDPRFEKGLADLRRSLLGFFEFRVRQLQHAGLVRPSLTPTFVAHARLGMIDGILNGLVLPDPDANLDDLARQLADYEWSGLRAR